MEVLSLSPVHWTNLSTEFPLPTDVLTGRALRLAFDELPM
jgi:hypothetical protein